MRISARNASRFEALVLSCLALLSKACAQAPGQQETGQREMGQQEAPSDTHPAAARWVVDPANEGPDLPPTGFSLFDLAFTRVLDGNVRYMIPFPFETLLDQLELRAGCEPHGASCTQRVLIPVGRSLQRLAAAPEFFAFPRVVVAVVRDGTLPGALSLKDRVFLGYQEKANLVEVISYNEAAARFEFQIIKDYRAGGDPQVVYANRRVCVACHQNQAPIFSRPQWDESGANPRVAMLLAAQRSSFYGIDAQQGISAPNAVDDATDRANLFSAYQRLWREGCGQEEPAGMRCRAALLTAALQHALTGERAFDSSSVAYLEAHATVLRNAAQRWPRGLAIPNADLANRDPLPAIGGPATSAHVPARLEALLPRPPIEIWKPEESSFVSRLVNGIAGFFSDSELRQLDQQLTELSRVTPAPVQRFTARCRLKESSSELRFDCDPTDAHAGASLHGRVEWDGRHIGIGQLDSFAVAERQPQRRYELTKGRVQRVGTAPRLSFVPSSGGLRARLPDGGALDSIELNCDDSSNGSATIAVMDDFRPLLEGVQQMASSGAASTALTSHAFDRPRVMRALRAALQLPTTTECCDDLARVQRQTQAAKPAPAELPPFARSLFAPCGSCHRTAEVSPANFLYGDGARVSRAVSACMPRILARLSMWKLEPAQREKTPMPPGRLSRGGAVLEHESQPRAEDLVSLLDSATEALSAEMGHTPEVSLLLERGYEALRPCLSADL